MPSFTPVQLDDDVPAFGLVPDVRKGTAVVVGNLDGVHRGHQALVARAVAEAQARGLFPVALTFDPHPSVTLGKPVPGLLTTIERRTELLLRGGARWVFVRRFDEAFSHWSAEKFVKEMLVRELSAKVVVSGQNFRFGHGREGGPELLARLAERLGFETFGAEVTDDEGPVSSTRARRAVMGGDLAAAEAVLGRRHALEGPVVKGDGRGRTLGVPTANVDCALVLPPNGVYAVLVDQVKFDGSAKALARGVMNVGVRPTVGEGQPRSVEVHLFDWPSDASGDLYGKILRAHLVEKLRDEARFDGLPALKAQIEEDARRAREITSKIEPHDGAFG